MRYGDGSTSHADPAGRLELALPLTYQQVEAACLLHSRLKQWRLSDMALARLAQAVPGFDVEACLLKTVAVNTLYGTRVLAIARMAEHVHAVLAKRQPELDSPELVTEIASLPRAGNENARRFTSFAAKFCHFFLDQERFPIYDEAAREAIKLHVPTSALVEDAVRPYEAFCRNLKYLREASGIRASGRHLDRYLWITGMYLKWCQVRRQPKPQMNVELRMIFDEATPEVAELLAVVLPGRTPNTTGSSRR